MHYQTIESKNILLRVAVLAALFAAVLATALGGAGTPHAVVRAGDVSEAVVYAPDWNSTGS
ncbi:hypothetical protein PV682_23475 [Streptomyces niveiscabiei]|uniref:hypothetical protein n=1 Tax=Streptomyces niveiscabiei TaxID=164115 RepID=UPI0029BF2443|nr:hypothetical protein [Streptomyces niveiscabiei]MDX3384403.1 hypothetical protein [Streptomyces niveiscabiei]